MDEIFYQSFLKVANLLKFPKFKIPSNSLHEDSLILRYAESLSKEGIPQSQALEEAMTTHVDDITEALGLLKFKPKPIAKGSFTGTPGAVNDISLKKVAKLRNQRLPK